MCAEWFKQRLEFQEVLFGKNFGGSHESRLITAVHSLKRRECRYDGFAASDVALNEAIHRRIADQVGINFVENSILCTRQSKGKTRDEFITQGSVRSEKTRSQKFVFDFPCVA